MNKSMLKQLGFGKQVIEVEKGNCPFCNKKIHPNKEFRDELSRQEYGISGLCQDCQNRIFVDA